MTWRTDTKDMAADLTAALARIRPPVLATGAAAEADALATVDTFCAIALRVFAATNPSKIKAAAMAVELQSLIPPGERRAGG